MEKNVEITEVRLNLIEGKNDLRALANITFDNCFVIRGLKVIEKDRFYVNMPSRRREDGTFSDIAFPVKNDMRIHIELKVLEKYEEELNKRYA